MARTFAEHILKHAAHWQASAVSIATVAAVPVAKAPQGPVRPAYSGTLGATYASVVLTMAMGAAAPAAKAATQGAVASAGDGSNAELGVSLIIPERIEARGFDHLQLMEQANSETGTSRLVGRTSGCVIGRGSRGYGVTVLPGSPYRLKLVARSTDCESDSLQTNLPASGEANKDNAWLEVSKFDSTQMAGDTLTLLISPE